MPLFPPTINGLANDHTSIRASFNGGTIIKEHIVAVNYDDKMTIQDQFGTHPIKFQRSLGQYKSNFSMTLTKDGWDQTLLSLPMGYTSVLFVVTIAYIRGPFPTVDTIINASILGVKNSSQQGQGGLTVELEMDSQYILRNGRCLAPIDADVTATTVVF